jgi:hypothetical protein
MLSEEALRAGREQVRADYIAAMQQFCFNPKTLNAERAFYLGVVMCMLALRHFVEEPKSNLLPGMESQDSMDAYFEAARGMLHAD